MTLIPNIYTSIPVGHGKMHSESPQASVTGQSEGGMFVENLKRCFY